MAFTDEGYMPGYDSQGPSPSMLGADITAPLDLYHNARWYAFRTRPRSEKKAVHLLGNRRITSYLPLVERERQWSDRVKKVEFPLFSGYIFARCTLTRLHEILQTPGVMHVVRVAGYPTPVREAELEAVRTMVEAARRAGVEPRICEPLRVGQQVTVCRGPFEGVRGTLIEFRGRSRVMVRLSAIRQALSVEIDRASLRPLEKAER